MWVAAVAPSAPPAPQGNPVQPTITIPQNSSQITINAQGQLTVMLPGSTPDRKSGARGERGDVGGCGRAVCSPGPPAHPGAADDHDPAEFLADHDQRAGPAHRDAAGFDH